MSLLSSRLASPVVAISDKMLRGYHHSVRMVRSLIAAELCPNCFEKFSLRQSKFRCEAEARLCPRGQDPISEKHWGDREFKGRVIEPKNRLYAASAECDHCHRRSRRRICPKCHADLPPGFGSTPNVTIAVIGAPDAGKTHYIAVLVDRLSKQVAPALRMAFFSADEATTLRYRQEIYETLFEKRQKLRKTASGAANVQVRKPLVYVLRKNGSGVFGDWAARSVTLSFFDSAGEDFNREDQTSAYAKHVIHCDGLILLIDPIQMPKARTKMARPPQLPASPLPAADILQSVTRLMVRGRGLGDTATVRVPLAVAATKFDAVKDQFPREHRVHQVPAAGQFRADDAQTVSTEVESQLLEWDQGELVAFVNARFAERHFFALSALGTSPDAHNMVAEIKPHRVEDALVWLLSRKGVL